MKVTEEEPMRDKIRNAQRGDSEIIKYLEDLAQARKIVTETQKG